MSRHPVDRPWLHNASGFWCATIEGRRVYLDHDYKVACRKLRERVADAKRRAAGADEWLDRPFAELADKFLDHIQRARKPQTYLGYQARLERALKVLGPRLRTGDVRKRHLAEIEAALPKSLSVDGSQKVQRWGGNACVTKSNACDPHRDLTRKHSDESHQQRFKKCIYQLVTSVVLVLAGASRLCTTYH